MGKNPKFDVLLKSNDLVSKPDIKNIAEMVFNRLPHRNENSSIILSHDFENYVEIKLDKFRYITASLIEEFDKKNIKPGDTVLLGTFSVNSEFLISLMFIALVSYGARVLLPMFVETSEVDNWIKKTECKFVILPKKEMLSIKDIPREKISVKKVIDSALKNNIPVYDLDNDFSIRSFVHQSIPNNFSFNNNFVKNSLKNTNLNTESVIFTTSGTSGRSKLLVYEQGAFLKNCISWKESGFYDKNKLGGRNFIDIFPHTISVRTFFNSIWTGFPICMVTSDWLKRKPEKILPFLIKMKPENVTGAPAHINTIINFAKLYPEIKDIVFSELKTVVSTGAAYSSNTKNKFKNTFGLILHNAYGTSETQQVLSTLLCTKDELEQTDMPIGKPLNGVIIGLTKFDEFSYKLYIKSPFGHKYIIDEDSEEKIFPDEYYYAGDIVKIDKNNNLFYTGREKIDFFKGSFGAKVPISYIRNYYKELYDQVEQIEYYSPETGTISPGLAALIFIENNSIACERVTDKKIINKYTKIIRKINVSLLEKLEPFEYDHRTINRFLLINSNIKKTFKGTLPKDEIEKKYKNEINDLIRLNKEESGLKFLYSPKFIFLKFLYRLLQMKNPFIRKRFLKFYLWYKRDKKNKL
jgi:acyl-coenzyme A synthetase/AMP-(fatty) acid ligase